MAISPSAKNSMILTAPYSEVSSAMTNLFLSELLQYIGNMLKKSLNVNDTRFGIYRHFKKGTFGLPYGKCWRKWVKTLDSPLETNHEMTRIITQF